MIAIVRPANGAVIEPGTDRRIDCHAMLNQHVGGSRAQAISPGAIDQWGGAEAIFDRAAQSAELFALKRGGEVSGKGIGLSHILVMGRVNPGMQLHADFGLALRNRIAQCCAGGGRCRHGKVDQIDRHDAGTLAEFLKAGEPGNRMEGITFAPDWAGPVEFLFGIDSQQKALAEISREADPLRMARQIGDARLRYDWGSPFPPGTS